MRRFIENDLRLWQESIRRKPLILRGARQVGKTWSLKEFGKQRFDSVAVVDFERNQNLRKLFESDLKVKRICSDLEVILQQQITPGKTLLFLTKFRPVPGQ